MNDIGLFISTFGGTGLFIFYLINKDKTTDKEQTREIKKMSAALDDFSIVLLDLLDKMIPDYGKRRNVKTVRSRINARQDERIREGKDNSDV